MRPDAWLWQGGRLVLPLARAAAVSTGLRVQELLAIRAAIVRSSVHRLRGRVRRVRTSEPNRTHTTRSLNRASPPPGAAALAPRAHQAQ